MSTRNRGIGLFVAGVLIASVLSSCGKPESSTAVPTGGAESATEEPAAVSVVGTIDFIDGEVSVLSTGADWRNAELGDEVRTADSIRTGKGASCDVGFGPFGLIRLGADSTVEIKTVLLSSERKVASVRLAAGSVACKVAKLSGNDRFEVRTQSAVCGVRGTEFLVKEQPGRPTRVAVREGSVAVLPPSFDADELEAAAGSGEAALVEAVVREIVQAAPLVEANEESVVSVAEMAESDRNMTAINEIIVRELGTLASVAKTRTPQTTAQETAAAAKTTAPASAAAPAEPSAPVQIPTSITASLAKYSTKAEAVIAPPAPLGIESKKTLEKLPETLSAAPSASIPPAAVEVKGATPESSAEAKTPESPAASAITASFKLTDAELVGGLMAQGDSFYAADAKGMLHVFGRDGQNRKNLQTGTATNENSRPVLAKGILYFAGPTALVSFDASSSARRFSVPLDQSNSGFFGRRPTLAAGKLFSSSDTGLDVFDAATGAKIGSVALADGSDMTPAVADDSVCLATRSGVFAIVSATTLEIAASIPTRTVEPIAAAAAIVGGRAYFADRKGTAVCVDLGSREVAWKRPLEAGKTVGVFEDPVMAGKTVLFFGKASLYGLSSTDGTPAFAPVRSVAGAPCIVDGVAWFGSADGAAKALDPATGKILVSLPLGGAVVGRSAASLNFIAFPLKNGNVVVIDATRALGGLKQ